VILFMDETIITETPPLRAAWALQGHQAEVPITGNRAKRILYGALNPKSGDLLLGESLRWDQVAVQRFFLALRRHWRGWHIVLFLDKGSPHTAGKSRHCAQDLRLALRWLPTACPELNPTEPLWRYAKQTVLANVPPRSIEESLGAATEALGSLAPHERLVKAGVCSGRFWLQAIIGNGHLS
jgi:transposase